MTSGLDQVITEAADRWAPRSEVLSLLGVKTQTLYAYVSRGRIAARPDPDNPRRSLYALADVIRLKGGSPGEAPTTVVPFEPEVKADPGVDLELEQLRARRLALEL